MRFDNPWTERTMLYVWGDLVARPKTSGAIMGALTGLGTAYFVVRYGAGGIGKAIYFLFASTAMFFGTFMYMWNRQEVSIRRGKVK
jgi:hypothetical protein